MTTKHTYTQNGTTAVVLGPAERATAELKSPHVIVKVTKPARHHKLGDVLVWEARDINSVDTRTRKR